MILGFNSIYEDERGVSLLELAITLPFLVVLIFGSLEAALKVYSLQTISAAAQEGVKVAAAYRAGASCALSPVPPSLPSPVTCLATPQILNTGVTFRRIARISTCNYLKEQGLDATRWEIKTAVTESTGINGKKFRFINLSIHERATSCTICINNALSLIRADSKAAMLLESCV